MMKLEKMKSFAKPGKTILVFLLLFQGAMAQQDSLSSIIRQFSDYKNKAFQEKLFLHIDRPAYLAGETMWFKIYCVDGTFHKPLDLSKVAYVELIDKDNKPIWQTKIKMAEGFGNGSHFLPATIPTGNYILRAYTHWMKNFDPAYYFQQPVTIINTFKTLGLTSYKDSSNYIIRFFPEGGNLVHNMESKIAFKATDKSGKGIDFTGFILNSKDDTVARFKPLKFGTGSFLFTPQANTNYRVLIKDNTKHLVNSQLPTIYEKGYVIRLDDIDSTKLKLTVNATIEPDENVYLFVHTRQVIKLAARNFLQQGSATFTVDKKLLGEGISHFTVFNASKQPVCERLYFKKPKRNLVIEGSTDAKEYGLRKKITIDVSSLNNSGKPESSNLSVAIYLADSLQTTLPQTDINSHLWLNSDLSGSVEQADEYLKDNNPTAVDHLMLTNGWRRFNWDDILSGKPVIVDFIPEFRGHIIQGKVMDSINNKPVSGIPSYLSSPGKIIRLYGSKSDKQGNIKFEMADFYGTKEIILQAVSNVGQRYKTEVITPFSAKFSQFPLPRFDIDDNFKNILVNRSIYMQAQNIYADKRINFIVPKIDSLPFYGIAEEKYKLDDFTRFKVMEDVMREYVPGVNVRKRKGKFHFTVHDSPNRSIFQDDPIVLLDGVPVFDIDSIMAFDPLKIKKLDVVTQKYYLGPYAFNGVVSYASYNGDLGGHTLNMPWLMLDYEGLQLQREFASPAYNTSSLENRIPDFRNLLYWSPEIKTGTTGKQTIEFYSSDIEGKFMVVIQGITKNGIAGSKKLTFEVKK